MQINSIKTPYIQNLQNSREQFQVAIEGLLEKYKVQPVGNGYIDLIIDCENALLLIEELANLSVAISNLTWWCKYTQESKLKLGCPHGMGGPINRFGEGWFSECVQYPDFVVSEHQDPVDVTSMAPRTYADECRKLTTNYIKNVFPHESFYSSCLHPGLWLYVPDDWRRKYFLL